MNELVDIENRAQIARITCGWKQPRLPLEDVLRYWRDVHSPAIARRAGIWDYRHYQFDAVRGDVLAPLDGIELRCPFNEQLMWTSDVRYLDDTALRAFGASPDREALALLLSDIELIVERSTTYRSLGDAARTWVDATGIAAPQGPPPCPQFAIFIRQRGEDVAFRAALAALAARWAALPGVLRLRCSLFEPPDMEAERRAGYPVKTHPVAQQYQAWIDLAVADGFDLRRLAPPGFAATLAASLRTLHVYPVRAVYTSVQGGRPTLVGLRGYAAWQAIEALGAAHQRDPRLLQWMYGEVAAERAASGGPQ